MAVSLKGPPRAAGVRALQILTLVHPTQRERESQRVRESERESERERESETARGGGRALSVDSVNSLHCILRPLREMNHVALSS